MHRNYPAMPPPQVQQPLRVVGVVMGLQNAVEAARWKTFGQVRQARVDQPTLVSAFN
jgi:hypothetical protein